MAHEMPADRIERDFREEVSSAVRLVNEGADLYLVFTPFCFDDGDHLTIFLKRDGPRWVLSDEAHTLMRLSYDVDYEELERGSIRESIVATLADFHIEDRDGELILDLTGRRYGAALSSYAQALLAIVERGKQKLLESPDSHSSAPLSSGVDRKWKTPR